MFACLEEQGGESFEGKEMRKGEGRAVSHLA